MEGFQLHVATNDVVALLRQLPRRFELIKKVTRPSVPTTVAVTVTGVRYEATCAFPAREIVIDVGDLVVVIDAEGDERLEFP